MTTRSIARSVGCSGHRRHKPDARPSRYAQSSNPNGSGYSGASSASDGGLSSLVDLREALLPLRKLSDGYQSLDDDLKAILESWFDVGLLHLERLTWESPAALLEKLIEYEAVHAIESWDDLRGRLGQGRRCYSFIHPAMPGEPLIFVEVALTLGIARELQPLLDHSRDRVDAANADTAIFYSISNCHQGLAGCRSATFIKTVVEELKRELPNLTTFATLSPIPGFRSWLSHELEHRDPLLVSEHAVLSPENPDDARTELAKLVTATATPTGPEFERAKPVLTRLVARYLLDERRGTRAADPVANFHLSNGARLEQINWLGNPGLSGWQRSLGFMVNYRYVPDQIEKNHFRYMSESVVAATDAVSRLRTAPEA
ncbi:MAG: malonyl-CoA decarboxylase family protein [Acidimicrobiales bacterium]